MSGAVRMVAWGVLEYNPLAPIAKNEAAGVFKSQLSKAREIFYLVKEEFELRDWLLTQRPYGARYDPFYREFILLGRLNITPGLVTREMIGEGTLREVCLAAIAYDDIWSVIP